MSYATVTDWLAVRTFSLADALTVPDGGFSVSASGLDVTSGYAVAIHPECERVLDDASPDDLLAYAREHVDTLSRAGRVFGGWRNPDDGRVYLDISTVTPSRENAMRLARETDQLAIFDFATLTSIPTE